MVQRLKVLNPGQIITGLNKAFIKTSQTVLSIPQEPNGMKFCGYWHIDSQTGGIYASLLDYANAFILTYHRVSENASRSAAYAAESRNITGNITKEMDAYTSIKLYNVKIGVGWKTFRIEEPLDESFLFAYHIPDEYFV